ncbi:hypothetical protein AHAS_Ahas09G0163600 [Arachis hypogaea]
MSQNGKLIPNLDQHSTKLLNITVLQCIDSFVEEILITTAHITFYEFNIDLYQWSRKDVEGSLFVVKRTTVRDAICNFIPKSVLTISPFNELLETKEDSDFLVDVVGLIRCALFSEYVDELNRFLSSRYAEQPVVVLQLAKVKVFRGRVGLQNVMFTSKLGFNIDIPEVAAFRKSFIPHGVSASQPISIVGS